MWATSPPFSSMYSSTLFRTSRSLISLPFRTFSSSSGEIWSPFELIKRRNDEWKVVITAEHASMELPSPLNLSWSSEDEWLKGTHWSYDPGSADFARELSDRMRGVPTLLSRFSRLVIDPNRPLTSETLFRKEAEGKKIKLNMHLNELEAKKRIDLCYVPFHQTLTRLLEEEDSQKTVNLILSLHSFTPVYENQPPRKVEIGVLYDKHPHLAEPLVKFLIEKGYDARLNEPWSGKEGFMFSAENSSDHLNRRRSRTSPSSSSSSPCGALMLEFRQDLVAKPEWRQQLITHLLSVFAGEKLGDYFLKSRK